MSLVVLILFIVFVLGPLARAAAGRIGAGDRALPGNAHEVVRLREEVDRLSAEVARLAEEQAFTLKLLAPGDQPPTPSPAGEAGETGGVAGEPVTPA